MLVSLREVELTAFNHHSPLTAQCPKADQEKLPQPCGYYKGLVCHPIDSELRLICLEVVALFTEETHPFWKVIRLLKFFGLLWENCPCLAGKRVRTYFS